jgi:hypothetical protein
VLSGVLASLLVDSISFGGGRHSAAYYARLLLPPFDDNVHEHSALAVVYNELH